MSYRSLSYSWSVKGNLLSLYITGEQQYPSPGSFENVYTIRISERRRATRAEVLAERGISEAEYRRRLREAMGSYYLDWWIGVGVPQDGCFWEGFDSTISDARLDAAEPYLDERGHLMASGVCSSLVGASGYRVSVDLDQYTLSGAYAAAIGRRDSAHEEEKAGKSETFAPVSIEVDGTVFAVELFGYEDRRLVLHSDGSCDFGVLGGDGASVEHGRWDQDQIRIGSADPFRYSRTGDTLTTYHFDGSKIVWQLRT
ncbi:MAG: hypothetical protein IK095_02270 [Oscillospiraceae bacterium]|nr:hypothetical protein [Oscillospiraceae bacterium]